MSQDDKKRVSLHTRLRLLGDGLLIHNRTLLVISIVVGATYAGVGMIGTVRVLYAQAEGASLAIISAMASAYIISNFAFQYPAGWLADRWGRKQVMLIGIGIDILLSTAYLIFTHPLIFIVLRFLEGITTALLLPAARALLIDTIPEEQQGKAFGTFAAFFNGGYLLGPGIGGLLAAASYQFAFIGAIIFRLIALLLVITLVTSVRRITPAETPKSNVSYKSLFLLPVLGIYIIALGESLYDGFDLSIMPLWMHDHLKASVTTIGLAYVSWALPITFLSPIGGVLADRINRPLLILILGIAQVPFYIIYGFLNTATFIFILYALHSCINTLMRPAVDAYVAAASPSTMRAQVQSIYSMIALSGSFIGATILPSFYALNFRFPLFILAATYGSSIIIGTTTIFLVEKRKRRAKLKE